MTEWACWSTVGYFCWNLSSLHIYIYIFFFDIPHTLFHVLSTFSILSFPLFVWYQQKAEETDLSFQLFLPSLLLLFTYPFFFIIFYFLSWFLLHLIDWYVSPKVCFPSYITAATFKKMTYAISIFIFNINDWWLVYTWDRTFEIGAHFIFF